MEAPKSSYRFVFQFVTGPEVIALGVVLPITCIIIVGLRFLVRKLQKVSIGSDDWLALAGLIPIIPMGGLLIAGAHLKYMGYPTPPPPPNMTLEEEVAYIAPSTETIEKLIFPFQIFMMFAYCFIKQSIVVFYRRIFVTHRGSAFDWITNATLVLIPIWALAFLILVIFSCGRHVWANWSSQLAEAMYCPAAFKNEYGFAISDLILDVFIFFMPLPLIWGLNLSTKRKFAVSGIILLGASAIGASIARLVLYVRGLKAVAAQTPIDTNQLITVSYYWSMLECGLALIAACLPSMSYLLTHSYIQRGITSIFSLLSSRGGTTKDSNTTERRGATRDTSSHDGSDGASGAGVYVELGEARKLSAGSSQDAILSKDTWKDNTTVYNESLAPVPAAPK